MRVRQVPLALDELAVLGVAIAGLAELARHVEVYMRAKSTRALQ